MFKCFQICKAAALKQKPALKLPEFSSSFVCAQAFLEEGGLTILLGNSENDKLAIIEKSLDILKSWDSRFSTHHSAALLVLNNELQELTFFATNYFTIADVVLYSLLYNVPLGPEDRLKFPNVVRYFDLVQHQVISLCTLPEEFELREYNLVVEHVENEAKKKNEEEKKKEGPKENLMKESLDPSKLDIRVGKILAVEKHPEADSLYVETIDVGEKNPRIVVSGLVKFMKEEDLLNRLVCLLCNLKPAKMRGIESAAMVLCANSGDVVELLTPPSGTKPGDSLKFGSFHGRPEEQLKLKQKVWESLQPCLFTNEKLEASFIDPHSQKEFILMGEKGAVKAATLSKASIK